MPGTTSTLELLAAILFGIAVVHTFATGALLRAAERFPRHAGVLRLLGEVEIVFGMWALVLLLAMVALESPAQALAYVEGLRFTEPLFVFAVMVIAATRPVLTCVRGGVGALARCMPGPGMAGSYFVLLGVVPLLGSLITEVAAMTVASLLLKDYVFGAPRSAALRYGTLGVLFVNVSIGGTLTHFAAPPVLMVATRWGWDTPFMLTAFGGRAVAAVAVNALLATLCFRRELAGIARSTPVDALPVPRFLSGVHLAFLVAVVLTAQHPVVFLGLLLLFLGVAVAYERHQDRLVLREALLVALFLSGLVVLGGPQRWWLEPALARLGETTAFYGAVVLTAFTDNAALTYLASLGGLGPALRQPLVSGAVIGGGLTIIANAPNPVGFAVLRPAFPGQAIRPLWLLAGALPPTLVAIAAFRLL